MTAADLCKQCEDYREKTYLCPSGLWTCGWGHTQGVTETTTCDKVQAEEWLAEDLQASSDTLAKFVTVPLTVPQREALLSFVFNVGESRFAKSTLLRKLNSGDYIGAADEFPRWIYGGGRRLPGLLARRQAERDLFTSDASLDR